jgi:hypothetical protein
VPQTSYKEGFYQRMRVKSEFPWPSSSELSLGGGLWVSYDPWVPCGLWVRVGVGSECCSGALQGAYLGVQGSGSENKTHSLLR